MGTNNPQSDADSLVLGDWNAICFRCGSKFKASKMRKTWQGFWTCDRCWEPRQPQDFATGIKEITTPPWTQQPGADKFVNPCTIQGMSAMPGQMIPGCTIPGRSLAPGYIVYNPSA